MMFGVSVFEIWCLFEFDDGVAVAVLIFAFGGCASGILGAIFWFSGRSFD